MVEGLGKKPVLLHHAQGLPKYILFNSCQAEEDEFEMHVKAIPTSEGPKDTNVISSHTVYKLKMLDDESSIPKVRIALHGNKESLKNDLCYNFSTCSPLEISVVLFLLH